jgi:hypothetical protein
MKAVFCFALFISALVRAASAEAPFPWHYTLVEGSYIWKDCPICGGPDGPIILEPISGSFELHLSDSTNVFVISDLSFSNANYSITGTGRLEFEKSKQYVSMQLQIARSGNPPEDLSFTNEVFDVNRTFPMISFVVKEETSSLIRVFTIEVNAAPLRDLWFSTTSQFTSATRPEESKVITAAEILSMSGRTVKKPTELSALLVLSDPFVDLGTDALDVGLGGEIFYSPGQPITSDTLGEIGEGDLITDKGRIVLHNEQLLAEFGVEGEPIDAGLDAIQQISQDEYYFSIRSNLVSTTIGAQIFNGDILSSKGVIVKTGQQLISALHPVDVETDAGLDAFYVWPNGEIWFSTERGFDSGLGAITPGDIVSDQGYIVFRNLDLLSPFAPIEDANSFGLDALYVITDVDTRGVSPEFTEVSRQGEFIRMQWEGTGRVFQLEKAATIDGLWSPVTPIIPDKTALDSMRSDAGFYRVRQW